MCYLMGGLSETTFIHSANTDPYHNLARGSLVKLVSLFFITVCDILKICICAFWQQKDVPDPAGLVSASRLGTGSSLRSPGFFGW